MVLVGVLGVAITASKVGVVTLAIEGVALEVEVGVVPIAIEVGVEARLIAVTVAKVFEGEGAVKGGAVGGFAEVVAAKEVVAPKVAEVVVEGGAEGGGASHAQVVEGSALEVGGGAA